MQDFYKNVEEKLKEHLSPRGAARIRCTGRGVELLYAKERPVWEKPHPHFELRAQKGPMLYLHAVEAFYREAMLHILQETEAPVPLEHVEDRVDLAYMRLYMRSRRARKGEILDEKHKEALWLCMGTVEADIDRRVRLYRLKESAEAILRLGREIPPRERPAYFENTGMAADCILALLRRGRSMIKE